MTSNRFKLLIMDFDGTIAQTLDDVVWCMRKTFEGYGHAAPDYTDVLSTVGLTLEDSFRALCKEPITEDKIGAWVSNYRKLYKTEGGTRTRLFPGMKESMQKAHEQGVNLLVVSNKGMAAIEHALETLGIDQYIDRVLSGDTTKHKKPNAELYNSEIKPLYPAFIDSDILVVGDTCVDLEFARNTDLKSCWVTYGYGKREECLALSPTYTIDNAKDLSGVVLAH